MNRRPPPVIVVIIKHTVISSCIHTHTTIIPTITIQLQYPSQFLRTVTNPLPVCGYLLVHVLCVWLLSQPTVYRLLLLLCEGIVFILLLLLLLFILLLLLPTIIVVESLLIVHLLILYIIYYPVRIHLNLSQYILFI